MEWFDDINKVADLLKWMIDECRIETENIPDFVRYSYKYNDEWKLYQNRYALQRFDTLSRTAVWDNWNDSFVRWSLSEDLKLPLNDTVLDEDELEFTLKKSPLDKSEYVALVWSRIKQVPNPDDIDGLKRDIAELYDDGFSADDAYSYIRCREEINPDLAEEIALKRMKQIRSKYPTPAL